MNTSPLQLDLATHGAAMRTVGIHDLLAIQVPHAGDEAPGRGVRRVPPIFGPESAVAMFGRKEPQKPRGCLRGRPAMYAKLPMFADTLFLANKKKVPLMPKLDSQVSRLRTFLEISHLAPEKTNDS